MISIKKHKFGFLFAVLVIALVSAAIGNQMKNGAQSQTEESIPAVKLIAVGDFGNKKPCGWKAAPSNRLIRRI